MLVIRKFKYFSIEQSGFRKFRSTNNLNQIKMDVAQSFGYKTISGFN